MQENDKQEMPRTIPEETKTAPETTGQKRWRSWAMWVSVLGLAGLVLNSTGVLKKLGLDSATWDAIVTALGTVLSAFGIVNNPTCKETF